jgi:hypothetical protein
LVLSEESQLPINLFQEVIQEANSDCPPFNYHIIIRGEKWHNLHARLAFDLSVLLECGNAALEVSLLEGQ